MNRQQFVDYMESPEALMQEASSALDSLLKEFPYFQTAHMLYVKKLHLQNSVLFPGQLKVAAAYTPDRKALYQLINGKKEKKEVFVPQDEVAVDEPEKEIPAIKKEEIPIPEINPAVEKTAEAATEDTLKGTPLEKEVMASALSATMEIEAELAQEEKKIAVRATTPAKTLDVNEKHSFVEWLKLLGNAESSLKNLKRKEKKGDKLIDKFLQEEPKISVPKPDFYSPVNMARQSVTEDMSFVTETLASIYAKQGLFSKAIAAYKALCLKYPEKSLYFAARINEIQNQIN